MDNSIEGPPEKSIFGQEYDAIFSDLLQLHQDIHNRHSVTIQMPRLSSHESLTLKSLPSFVTRCI